MKFGERFLPCAKENIFVLGADALYVAIYKALNVLDGNQILMTVHILRHPAKSDDIS